MSVGPRMVRVRASGTAESAARTVAVVGRHRVVTDEPASRGGSDLAASPVDTLVASLAGCTVVIAHRIATELGVRLGDMSVVVTATVDTDVLQPVHDVETPFPAVALQIDAETDASAEQLAALRAQLGRRCPIVALFKAAGANVTDHWTVRPPA